MKLTNTTALSVQQPFYFPLKNTRYEVKPGLFQFPHDFDNGLADQLIFQFDALFPQYHSAKQAAREERLAKYYCTDRLSAACLQQVNRFIIEKLSQQNPQQFELHQHGNELHLHCKLSNEKLILDQNYRLLKTTGQHSSVTYRDTFDALANQLQEDLALIQLSQDGSDYISALHLCFANHWAAEEKIGRSFSQAHVPVPNIESINRHANKLIHSLIHKGPFIRFAWGIATDTRLNHHPAAPTGISAEMWQGRCFNPQKPELYLRVERQTLHGMPQTQCALFTIRTYFYDVATLISDPEHKIQLIGAIESMSEEDLSYKGLLADKQAILDWLKS